MFKIVLECNSVNFDENSIVSDLSYQFSAIMGSPGTSENRQVLSVTGESGFYMVILRTCRFSLVPEGTGWFHQFPRETVKVRF